jgi:dihydrofolate synthase/folylpolyglutamate synthase
MMSRFDSLQTWLRWQENYHPRPIDLGLERTASVFDKLNPQAIKPTTITVAGTNGKGSSVAFLESIYRAAGYKVGTYTSPHIVAYNERIKIDGEPVSDALICEAFARIDAVRGAISLSYFEFGTLAALDIFARADLDVQLLEVGLGGRLDAVNIVDADVAVISSIDIDHVDWLGHTREHIGREKAGIFRHATPAVIGDLNPPQSLLDHAHEQQTILWRIQKEFTYQKQRDGWDWLSAEICYRQLPYPQLMGEHQLCNAATIICALTQLQLRLPVSETAIRQGIVQTQLKGRFQLVAGDIPVLLDVAHNPQAVASLRTHLDDYFADKKIYAVFAMMKDKDIGSVLARMKSRVSAWFIAPLNNPRAATEAMLGDLFAEQGIDTVSIGFQNFADSFQAAQKTAQTGDLIVIFGSFFLVSEYLIYSKNL